MNCKNIGKETNIQNPIFLCPELFFSVACYLKCQPQQNVVLGEATEGILNENPGGCFLERVHTCEFDHLPQTRQFTATAEEPQQTEALQLSEAPVLLWP